MLSSTFKAASLDSDIVYASSTPLTIALPAIIAALKCNVPMVLEVRDLWPEMPIAIGALNNPLAIFAARALELLAYKSASSIVALSPGMKSGILRCCPSSKPIAVIPNSCDNVEFAFDQEAATSFRASRPWIGDSPLLIYAGTFGRVNGLSYAVDLAQNLSLIGSNIRLLLVGDGAEWELIERLAHDSNVLSKNLFDNKSTERHPSLVFCGNNLFKSLLAA